MKNQQDGQPVESGKSADSTQLPVSDSSVSESEAICQAFLAQDFARFFISVEGL